MLTKRRATGLSIRSRSTASDLSREQGLSSLPYISFFPLHIFALTFRPFHMSVPKSAHVGLKDVRSIPLQYSFVLFNSITHLLSLDPSLIIPRHASTQSASEFHVTLMDLTFHGGLIALSDTSEVVISCFKVSRSAIHCSASRYVKIKSLFSPKQVRRVDEVIVSCHLHFHASFTTA
jgi:hypothetical protein